MTAWLMPNGLFTANTVLPFSPRTSTVSSFRLVVTLTMAACSLGSAPPPAAARLVMVRYPARPAAIRGSPAFIRTSADALLPLLHDDPVACPAEQIEDSLQPLPVEAPCQGE